MELASMLSGARFSDRPTSACPIVAALLRAYNDNVDQRRRSELYRYAAEAVGTRGDFGLQLRRAWAALTWGQARYAQRRRLFRHTPDPPRPDDAPDLIAHYVLRSFGRLSDETHCAVLELLDQLIAMGAEPPDVKAARLRHGQLDGRHLGNALEADTRKSPAMRGS